MSEGMTKADLAVRDTKVNILGVYIDATNLTDVSAQVMRWIAAQKRTYVCVTSVHGIMESQRKPDVKDIHNAAGMVTPDGMPLVYVSRAYGHPDCERVYGPDLMLEICRQSVPLGYRHYFFGTTPRTLNRLASRLCARFPGLQVAGAYSPPFRRQAAYERADAVARINESLPDIVWVGLSTPKQERWMAQNRHLVQASVMLGVGAAFDFHSGSLRQAPAWMQPLCLEWLFRLFVEPTRLWKRYLVNNPQFLFSLALQRLGLRTY
jgi:N-acetylglucosaminyldiphosphoundecaprenol N-acetyl-beta-D-mannosaminyltransferase